MSKISNPWLTPLQRSFHKIKYTLINRVKSLRDKNGNQMITDYSEGNILILIISMFSAIAEVLHYYIDNVARESFFTTARKYSSLVKHAAMLDYYPKSATPARVEVILSRTVDDNSITQDILIRKGSIFRDVNGNIWETEKGTTWFSNTLTCRVSLIQQELYRVSSLNGNFLPSTNGQVVLQLPKVNNKHYSQGTLEISLDGTAWSYVETLAYSRSWDTHFTTRSTSNGDIQIVFGDGRFGKKPSSTSEVTYCAYMSTMGSLGNVPSNSLTIVPTDISSRVNTALCNNPLPAYGGSDYEDFYLLKSRVPMSIKTLGVAITKEDYYNLVMAMPEVSKAAVEYTLGKSIIVYVSPIGGGIATQALLDKVKNTLLSKTPLSVRVSVKPVGTVNIKLDITVTGKKSCSSHIITTAIQQALLEAYSPDKVDISSSVRISDIYALIDNLPVVDHLFINKFYIKPWPVTIYGSSQLIINEFDLISSEGSNSVEYIVTFHNNNEYYIRSKFQGYYSGVEPLVVGNTYRIEDTCNNYTYSLNISPNGYQRGFTYKFVVVKPNYDYTEPGYNLPVFTNPDTQLVLTINETV